MNKQVLDFVKNAGLTGRIIDVGSLNVNGQVRDVLKIEAGVDMRPGAGVDVVCKAEELPQHFRDLDAVTFCDTLEHCENWRGALSGVWESLKIGGRLAFTIPHKSKGFHGYPDDFWRLSPEQARQVFKDQQIENEELDLGCSFGLIVQKVTDSLDLSVEPEPVVRKDKNSKKDKKASRHNKVRR